MDKTKTNTTTTKSNITKTSDTSKSTNVLPDFSTPIYFYPILLIIIRNRHTDESIQR